MCVLDKIPATDISHMAAFPVEGLAVTILG